MGKRKNRSESLVIAHAELADDPFENLEAMLDGIEIPAVEAADDEVIVEEVSAEETSIDDELAALESSLEVADEVAVAAEVEALDALDMAEAIGAPVEEVAEAVAEAVEPVIEAVAETVGEPSLDAVLAAIELPVAVLGDAAAAPAAAEAPPKKEKKAAKPKDDKPKKERIYFGADKVRRLRHNLGDKLGDFLVLTMSDASL
jgi:hypothetical protein